MIDHWEPYEYDGIGNILPAPHDLVWVYDRYYLGVAVGMWDGRTWRVMPGSSDECNVTHWRHIVGRPDPPYTNV